MEKVRTPVERLEAYRAMLEKRIESLLIDVDRLCAMVEDTDKAIFEEQNVAELSEAMWSGQLTQAEGEQNNGKNN